MQITNLYASPDWHAIAQGVRLSWGSMDLSDTDAEMERWGELGPKDHKLLLRLSKKSASHRKFLRMAPIHLKVRAPLYWWKQFDTYKVGTVSLSSSTMHTLQQKHTDEPFSLDDFAIPERVDHTGNLSVHRSTWEAMSALTYVISTLNDLYKAYQETKNPVLFDAMVRLMPCGYLQTRQILFNYEVARTIYNDRRDHILPEWRQFCRFLEWLPSSEFIIGD